MYEGEVVCWNDADENADTDSEIDVVEEVDADAAAVTLCEIDGQIAGVWTEGDEIVVILGTGLGIDAETDCPAWYILFLILVLIG